MCNHFSHLREGGHSTANGAAPCAAPGARQAAAFEASLAGSIPVLDPEPGDAWVLGYFGILSNGLFTDL